MTKKYYSIAIAVVLIGAVIAVIWQAGSRDKVPAAVKNGAQNENAKWKTTESETLRFQYPEELPTKYIFAQEWPPMVDVKIAQFLCAEKLQQINDRQYCVGKKNDAAAGSIYTTYTYNTTKNNRMVTLRFVVRYLQCDNYNIPQKTECNNEREAFNIDSLVDDIVETIAIKI